MRIISKIETKKSARLAGFQKNNDTTINFEYFFCDRR